MALNMKLTKYIIVSLALMASMFSANAESWKSDKYSIDRMQVQREHGLVKVTMTIEPSRYHLGTNKRITIVPVLKSLETDDSVAMQPVVIAGRNSFYSAQRAGLPTDQLLRSGSGDAVSYEAQTEWADWMEHSQLDLTSCVTGCCGVTENKDERHHVAELDWRPVNFIPEFHYMVPKAEESKTRKIEGKAYVNFPVNRTEIYPEYMLNPQELRKITSGIDSVRMNPDATVKSITLVGFASPEGPYKNNIRLAAGRTEAVKEYVRKMYTFPAETFKTNSVPEDWEGLRDSVAVSILADRNEILDFIDNGNVPVEQRNDKLRARFPQSYAYLLKNIYPWLRHTNYVIDYEIRSYTDINEIRRVLRERPENLSLNEFYLAANSYPVGSPEYDKVFDTALLYHKDSEVANLNAANSAMNEGDFKRARMLLNRLSSPQANYGKAVLAALEGNYDAAEKGFEQAEADGIAQASGALKQIRNLKVHRDNIRYYPDLDK